jgi:ParB family chromosome partitioning protein
MAKRKRLEPVVTSQDMPASLSLPEARLGVSAFSAPPIAQVAQDAAREAAFDEVSTALIQARVEGRLAQKIAIEEINLDHLLRDRVGVDEAEMTPLMESLRARGQQTPVEVVALAQGRFGLISGWRRILALRRLHEETGDDRFATALAFLRRPRDAAEAYVAMVEENEIRLGLSHYERARIVAGSVAQGIFPDPQTALRSLFANGSRARRSKIGSFLVVVNGLDSVLRFPMKIGERLGLALAQRLEASPDFARDLALRLGKAAPASAEAELAVLEQALRDGAGRKARQAAAIAEEPAPGIRLVAAGGGLRQILTLSGPKVDQDFTARLIAWLKTQGRA